MDDKEDNQIRATEIQAILENGLYLPEEERELLEELQDINDYLEAEKLA